MAENDTKDDEAEIGDALITLARAFGQSKIQGVAELYAEDADWTNAFGTTLNGRDEILAYLEHLFADSHFTAGRLIGQPEATIRFVGNSVAIAKTYAEREGQQTADGESLPVRRNFSIKVFEKQNGHWQIVSDLYMDARDEQTLVSSTR